MLISSTGYCYDFPSSIAVQPYYKELSVEVDKARGENFNENMDIIGTIDFVLFKLSIGCNDTTTKFLYEKTLDIYSRVQSRISKKWYSFDTETQVVLTAFDRKAVIMTNEIAETRSVELMEKLLPALLILTIKSMYYII